MASPGGATGGPRERTPEAAGGPGEAGGWGSSRGGGVPRAALLALAVALLAMAGPARSAQADEGASGAVSEPESWVSKVQEDSGLPPVPADYVVTNGSLSDVLKRAATDRGEVIFTTIQLAYPKHAPDLAMLRNFCYWLERVGYLDNLLVLTTHNRTFWLIHELGLPVYLDLASPKRPGYGEGVSTDDSPNRVFDVQKHWWGWATVHAGFHALYMDADGVVIRDPMGPFRDTAYEVQGLSDWVNASTPPVGATLDVSCGLYAMLAWAEAPRGGILCEWWRYPPNPRALQHANPCQSTGVWYLRPTPATEAFSLAMVYRLLSPKTLRQWDQTAFNEVILPFLWGAAGQPPLSYRLLSHSFAANVNSYDARRSEGLATSLAILHSGYLHGGEKADAYSRLGFWRPDYRVAEGLHGARPARTGRSDGADPAPRRIADEGETLDPLDAVAGGGGARLRRAADLGPPTPQRRRRAFGAALAHGAAFVTGGGLALAALVALGVGGHNHRGGASVSGIPLNGLPAGFLPLSGAHGTPAPTILPSLATPFGTSGNFSRSPTRHTAQRPRV